MTAREILDAGTERIEREFASEPDIQADLLGEVAEIYQNLGMLTRAESLIRQSLELRESEFGAGSLESSLSLAQLGRLMEVVGRPEEAIGHLNEAVRIREGEELVADTMLGSAQADLGRVLRSQGHYQEAQTAWTRSVEIRRATLSEDDPRIAESLMGLASAFHDGGRLDVAIELFEELLREHGQGDRPSPLAATAGLQVGLVYRLREQYSAAEPLVRQAVDIRTTVFGPDHPDTIEALKEFGSVLEALGRYADAERTMLEVRDRAVRLYGTEHPVISSADEILAILEVSLGRYGDAHARYDTILAAKARRYGGDHADPMFTLFRAVEAPLAGGDPGAATERFEAAVAMRTRLADGEPGAGGVTDILATSAQARLEDLRGEASLAAASFERAVSMAEEALREGHRYRQRVNREQAIYWIDTGRPGPAVRVLEGNR